MRKFLIISLTILTVLILPGCDHKKETKITKDMAYEGVNNYCHQKYDWSIAENNPSIMYVTMGEENDKEYQVTFRSYTGAFVYFYVDKETGIVKMEEYVPILDAKSDLGTIKLSDYLNNKKEENKQVEEKPVYKNEKTLKLNNKNIKINLTTKYDTENEYFEVLISLNDKIIGSFEEYDEEEIKGIIENFSTNKIKGLDNKEYLLLIFDSGGIPKEKMFLTNESKTLAYIESMENLAGKLSNNTRYKKSENNKTTKFYSIGSNRIYYLTSDIEEAKENMKLEEHELTIKNSVVTTKKNGKTYKLTDLDGGDSTFVTVEIK